MSDEDWIAYFNATLDENVALEKMTRNRISYLTGLFAVGIKDHMGHFVMSDENIERIFTITSQSKLLYMSHTQDPAHTERLVNLSKGRPLHLGHATACGCGSHMEGEEAMKMIAEFCKKDNISGEFVTTQLRKNRGRREGLKMTEKAQEIAFEALKNGVVDILISDGQGDATMKGFGDSRDDLPAIFELAEMGILNLSQAVATMTHNPAKLFAKCNGDNWWIRELGHLGAGAYANVTVADPYTKTAMYTFVNGVLVNFEQRNVRGGETAGGWVSRKGILKRTGVGDLAMFSYTK
jgi:dihydroorotase-like cyclic amidohydrolase